MRAGGHPALAEPLHFYLMEIFIGPMFEPTTRTLVRMYLWLMASMRHHWLRRLELANSVPLVLPQAVFQEFGSVPFIDESNKLLLEPYVKLVKVLLVKGTRLPAEIALRIVNEANFDVTDVHVIHWIRTHVPHPIGDSHRPFPQIDF